MQAGKEERGGKGSRQSGTLETTPEIHIHKNKYPPTQTPSRELKLHTQTLALSNAPCPASSAPQHSPQAAGLPLRLEEGKDVVFPDGPLDVADDRTASVVEKLNAHLGDATSPAGAAQDLGNLGKLDGIVLSSKGAYESDSARGKNQKMHVSPSALASPATVARAPKIPQRSVHRADISHRDQLE